MEPWRQVTTVGAADFAHIRRRAIFDCCKWDPQVQDVSVIAPFPLVLSATSWNELAGLAESLAAEMMAAEAELVERPELHAKLGLPRTLRRALRPAARHGRSPGVARLIRFDFHHTTEGWRISEANTDVPGGINEAAGFPALFAPHYPGTTSTGDPAAAIVAALSRVAERVGLLHATAFSDDNQVMTYLARRLETAGVRALLASPAHVRWHDGSAVIDNGTRTGVDAIARFFPAEWLPDLPARCGWQHFFAGARTPACNPATSLLTQSKRFPLVWDALDTALPVWRRVLPETVDPCTPRSGPDWILKPAFGRVGEDIGMEGVVSKKELMAVQRAARRHPGAWIAQRRFEATSLTIDGQPHYPCIGVYTVDGRAAGAYGRVAARPLIDWRAQDAAILVTREGTDT